MEIKTKVDYKKAKRIQKRKRKKLARTAPENNRLTIEEIKKLIKKPTELNEEIETEYVDDDNEILQGRAGTDFKRVFEYFKMSEKGRKIVEEPEEEIKKESEKQNISFVEVNYGNLPENIPLESMALSKKKLKQLRRMKVFELKQTVRRPDVVEVWDVTAADPFFLVYLKSYRNSVPVPKHWPQKRKFLQYKRGIPKPPLQLPDFIEATGITRIRNVIGHDPGRNVRKKMSERMNPKLGKMEIDYQILHDAFFKYQKKPMLTVHGDVYYEGKEYEIKMRKFHPGKVSPSLRAALGIPESTPPPWLINIQRYGPPPSYPNLKIPGVNVPMPETISWGRLFKDERDYTIYADCQGLTRSQEERNTTLAEHWGELKSDEEEEEESESMEEEEEEKEPIRYQVSGLASVVSEGGFETPAVDIRKPVSSAPREPGDGPFQVLEQFERRPTGSNILEPGYGYRLPGECNSEKKSTSQTAFPQPKSKKKNLDNIF